MDTRTADELHVPQQKTSWMDFVKSHFRDYGMLLSLLVIMLFFQVVTNGTLLRPLNLTNLVLQNSYIVIMARSEEHTSELQSRQYLVCRLLLEKKKQQPTVAPEQV